MKKDKGKRFRLGFSQTISRFLNIFTFCSRQSTSKIMKDSSCTNSFILSTPVIRQATIHVSQNRIDYNHFKLSYYPTIFSPIDLKNSSHHLMPQIVLVDSEFSTNNNDMMHHVVNDSNSTSGHLYKGKIEETDMLHCCYCCTCQKKEPVSSFSSMSSSSNVSNCRLSMTVHQCYSSNTLPSMAEAGNIDMLNRSSTTIVEKSPVLPSVPTSSRFSYLIRPSTPCILGTEDYDDGSLNDDEFFLTAGGIVHSCPNIYELSVDNHRKLQSCDHLMYLDRHKKLINNDNLNSYDTEFDRYSIFPRFHANISSLSTDSIDSQLKLYKERHAIGFSRPYHNENLVHSSLLPTTWKSDNYLLFMPLVHDHRVSSFNSVGHEKRTRSYYVPIEQTYSSVIA